MDRTLEVKATRFVVPEIYIGKHLLDKIQCDYFQIEVNDTLCILTFVLLINMRPTLVYGADDLEYLKKQKNDFVELLLKDGNVIKKIIRYFALNKIWQGYQRRVRFDFGSNDSAVFDVNLKKESGSLIRIIKIQALF
jgi:hypothetical protein